MNWSASNIRQRVCALVLYFVFQANSFASDEKPTIDWWSFKQAARPVVPAASSKWPRNEIDQFVLRTLSSNGIAPSAEADRRTLIRRVTFDLIGLPPTPDEVAAFIADQSTNAYGKVVERLLDSPRYGERWARHWLDAVHYGETHGYDKDKPRLNAWPYRDYVIASLNDDKPYARFVQEQIAADVLFPDDPKLIAALGFIAAGPWDFVGHVELPITKTDGLIARYNDRDDMVMNTMSTFQSLTVHCARCHDHKFDPIPQRDYYGLQAVFAGVDRADRPFDESAEVSRKRAAREARLRELQQTLKTVEQEIARLGGKALKAADERVAELERGAKKSPAFGYHSETDQQPDKTKWVQVDLGSSMEIAAIEIAPCHDDFNNIGAGFGFPPRYTIQVGNDPGFGSDTKVVADHISTDVPNPGIAVQRVVVNSTGRYVRFTATRLAPRKGDYMFALSELRVLTVDGKNVALGARVSASDSIEAPPRWSRANLVDGIYPALTNTSAMLAEAKDAREALMRALPADVLAWRKSTQEQIAAAKAELARLPKPKLVYAAASDFPANGSFTPAKTPRPVHLLRRGEVKRAGEEMKPAALTHVPGLTSALELSDLQREELRRAALAQWITSTNNMLTRRSIVNRIWALHFGAGIVDTPNDFGRMGGQPSHPELLDWLAFWFLDNGESWKKLHRLIVTSATYRQQSQSRAEAARADAGNRLLWRMSSPRLDAEQFRDALLALSGRLDLTMGGPSVQQFGFKDDHSPVYDYGAADVDSASARRRSIYRFIVRSVPDPFMDALDCPDASTPTPVRNVTTTALQALATLNDRFVLRQCEHLAARLEAERRDLDPQVTRAFDLALNRPPKEAERRAFVEHAKKHGLASACRVLVNSNEFMFLD